MPGLVNAAFQAAWVPLTQRGIYWGTGYLVIGGIAAATGYPVHGAITMIAGLVLACTCLAPLARA